MNRQVPWKRTPRFGSSCLALFLFAAPVPATAASSVAETLLESESRLDARVTVSEERITIGELLDRLSSKTGIRLEADDRLAPVSGYEVTAVFHDRPAREVLDALRATYHAPPDRWFWTRERSRKSSRLVLRGTLPPAAAADARERWAHEFRVEQRRKRGAFFASSPERQALLRASDPELRYTTPRSPWLFSFVASLSDQDLWEVSRGRKIEIPTAELTPGQRQFIRDEYGRARRMPGAFDAAGPLPIEKVEVFGSEGTVYLDLGDIGANGVLGGNGLEAAELDVSRKQWIGERDRAEAPNRGVPAPEEVRNTRPEELVVNKLGIPEILARLARKGRLNLIADLPPSITSQNFSLEERLEGSVSDVLKSLWPLRMIWKTRGEFLLFRPVDWPRRRLESGAPWTVIRELREHAANNGGYLEFADWLRLSQLDAVQLNLLAHEFPDAQVIRAYQTVLRLYAGMSQREKTACARLEGAGWNDFSNATRSRLEVLFPEQSAQRLRIVIRPKDQPHPPTLTVFISPNAHETRPVSLVFKRQVSSH